MLFSLLFFPLLWKVEQLQDFAWKSIKEPVASNSDKISSWANLSEEDIKMLAKLAVQYIIWGLTIVPFVISTAVFFYLPFDEGFKTMPNPWLTSFLVSLALNLFIILVSPNFTKSILFQRIYAKLPALTKGALYFGGTIQFIDQSCGCGCTGGIYGRVFKWFMDENDCCYCNIFCPGCSEAKIGQEPQP